MQWLVCSSWEQLSSMQNIVVKLGITCPVWFLAQAGLPLQDFKVLTDCETRLHQVHMENLYRCSSLYLNPANSVLLLPTVVS